MVRFIVLTHKGPENWPEDAVGGKKEKKKREYKVRLEKSWNNVLLRHTIFGQPASIIEFGVNFDKFQGTNRRLYRPLSVEICFFWI